MIPPLRVQMGGSFDARGIFVLCDHFGFSFSLRMRGTFVDMHWIRSCCWIMQAQKRAAVVLLSLDAE